MIQLHCSLAFAFALVALFARSILSFFVAGGSEKGQVALLIKRNSTQRRTVGNMDEITNDRKGKPGPVALAANRSPRRVRVRASQACFVDAHHIVGASPLCPVLVGYRSFGMLKCTLSLSLCPSRSGAFPSLQTICLVLRPVPPTSTSRVLLLATTNRDVPGTNDTNYGMGAG